MVAPTRIEVLHEAETFGDAYIAAVRARERIGEFTYSAASVARLDEALKHAQAANFEVLLYAQTLCECEAARDVLFAIPMDVLSAISSNEPRGFPAKKAPHGSPTTGG